MRQIKSRRWMTLFAALLSAASCSGGKVTSTDQGLADSSEPASDAVEVAADLGLDFEALPRPETEIRPECAPGEGCFGDPCSDNKDCLSGLCIEHLGDRICSSFCQEECPDGFKCLQISAGGSDLLFACVSNFPFLCRPCQADSDCSAGWGGKEACIAYGNEGSFCGGTCDAQTPCPTGYTCKEAETTLGITASHCIPDAGLCSCSPLSAKLTLATSCLSSNEWGICKGIRFCTPEGLSECDAPAASADVCNGLDDDCDGAVDEPGCDDGNPCTSEKCLGKEGCQTTPLDGLECDDSDACTGSDFCQDGQCKGSPVDCDDQDVCTDDSCDPISGCAHTHNLAPCDDNEPCTVGDKCIQGTCAGTPVTCDCSTSDDCKALEDGDPCNGTLVCDTSKIPFQCKIDPVTVVVCPEPQGLDGYCRKNACDPATGLCVELPAKEGLACTDASSCTLGDTCTQGLCKPASALSCDDGNPCTLDPCDPAAGCLHSPADGPCDDGNPCTLGDTCTQGLCKPASALSCDDGNLCTTDSCDPTLGCLNVANQAPCDDADACTLLDVCAAGECTSGATIDCDDDNPCTSDSCDSAAGCVNLPVDSLCDDGNSCTLGDHCLAGKCVPDKVIECDDDNPCTNDVCDLVQGCQHVANSLPCDDQNPCTTGDTCADKLCNPGGKTVCDDANPCTDDSCDKSKGCVFAPNTLPCTDGNLCTLDDHCANGKCVSDEPKNCDDENPCTTDTCKPLSGCISLANALPCSDGNPCTVGDTCADGTCKKGKDLVCNDSNPCTDDSCNPAEGCVFAPNKALCDDGNVCTEDDVCSAGWCGGSPVDCEDGNPCTSDYCQAGQGCIHTVNSLPCNDKNACTVGDTCKNGACVPGTGNLKCDDQEVCTADSCNSDTGCVFTPVTPCCGNQVVEAGESCDDGNDVGGDGCSADCKSDETCGNSVFDPDTEECDGASIPVKCHKGKFNCTVDCALDDSACSSWCGDGVLDKTYEACDDDLFPVACHEGQFACQFGCKVWDKSACLGWCGDGVANYSEECDGFDIPAGVCPLSECFCSSDCKLYVDAQQGAQDWTSGQMDGVNNTPQSSPDPECLKPETLCLDATTKSLNDIWIANSNDHEVVRINVDTGAVEKEIPSQGENPSRTAVVTKDSSVWVGNRSWNNYNSATYSNLVHFTRDGKLICRGDVTGMVRAVGIDKDGNVWAGSWYQHKVFKFSGSEIDDTQSPVRCKLLAEVAIPACPYGAIGDNKGNIWIAGNCAWTSSFDPATESISKIDVTTNALVGTYVAPSNLSGCFAVYGITVDSQGRVIVGTHADNCRGLFRYTPGTNAWEWISSGFVGSTRGVVVDQEGYIYSAISHGDGGDRRHIVRVTPDFKSISALDLGNGIWHPVGVAIDRNGKLWTAGRNSGSSARIDVKNWANNPQVNIFPTNGSDPYSYSDMTGFQHLMFTNPEGTWRQQFDGGAKTVYWKLIEWTGKEEAGVTDISVRARAAATKDGLALAGWTGYFTNSPALLEGLPNLQWLEVEVKLSSKDSNKTPILTGLTVHWTK